MAKNRNKGFSLIEVVIGVAVLTILLTPVVKQLAQTMRTNRLAKEQQYANESATNVLEYAQKTSFNDLKVTGTSGDIYVTSVSAKKDRTCDIYIYNSTDGIKSIDYYASSEGLKVNYGVTTYGINDVALGSRKTEYTRTLILDDLSNKLSEFEFTDKSNPSLKYGLTVLYDQSKSVSIPDELSSAGYSYTSEGSIVQYKTDDDGTYISGIVCTKKNSSDIVSDPNQSLLGSMTDLDSTQVALVNGDISNFDEQAQKDMYAAGLAYLKSHNPGTYQQVLNGHYEDGDGVLQQYGYISSLKKTTTITIDEGKDASTSKPYYKVNVDVHYSSALMDGNNVLDTISLDYNVFSQKFYYDDSDGKTAPTVPSVYIEYQPFSVDGEQYAGDEYIFIENYVNDAKIYLYQPAKDLSYAKAKEKENTSVNPDSVESTTGNYVKDKSELGSSKVKIHINTLTKTDADKTTNGKVTTIYTNLVDTSEVDGNIVRSVDTENQFDLSEITDLSLYSSNEYSSFEEVNPATYTPGKTTLYLKDVQEDKTNSDRLYTATVIVAPKTESVNTVTLTGAKGGQ